MKEHLNNLFLLNLKSWLKAPFFAIQYGINNTKNKFGFLKLNLIRRPKKICFGCKKWNVNSRYFSKPFRPNFKENFHNNTVALFSHFGNVRNVFGWCWGRKSKRIFTSNYSTRNPRRTDECNIFKIWWFTNLLSISAAIWKLWWKLYEKALDRISKFSTFRFQAMYLISSFNDKHLFYFTWHKCYMLLRHCPVRHC